MGYRTPNIDRIANEGAIFTDCLRPAELHGRPRLVHPRPGAVPHRPADHRHAGRSARHRRLDADDRRRAEDAGLRHRPVRQEPPRRPATSTCRPTHGFDEFFGNLYHLNAEEEPEGYFYPKDPEFRKKYGPRGVHQDLVGRQDRGHRPAQHQAHADRRRGIPGRAPRTSSTARPRPTSRSSAGSTPRACTSSRISRRSRWARPARASMPTAWSSMTAMSAQLLKLLDDLRHRRQHHRALHDRQRRRDRAVAGRRHDDVPRREGHDLGRRLPHPDDGALAGRHQAGHAVSTTSSR